MSESLEKDPRLSESLEEKDPCLSESLEEKDPRLSESLEEKDPRLSESLEGAKEEARGPCLNGSLENCV